MADEFEHQPAMVDDVVDAFTMVPPGVVVDGTVGGGGHASALLDRIPSIGVLGLDRDPDAVVAARRRLGAYGRRAAVRHAHFARVAAEVADARATGGPAWPGAPGAPVVGVFLDLGVSSPQLDRPERGFSYRAAGPLDMRMDPGTGPTAAELVNTADPEELVRLFADNGEARLARRITRAIVAARPIETTGALAAVVDRAVPAAARRRGHPAARVFQALRVAVNSELDELEAALSDGLALLAPGGRMAVIAYHSGEDRMVKAVFADASTGGCTCPPQLPCVCGARPGFRLVARGSRKPGPDEIERNPRVRSARLRVIERLDEQTTERA